MYFAETLKSSEYKKYSKCNLPMKYMDANLDDFKILGNVNEKAHNQKMFDKFMDYYNDIENNLRNGTGIILCGSVGIAKTWLLTCLSKKIIEIFDKENENIKDAEDEGDIKNGIIYNNLYYIQATTLSQMTFTNNLSEQELKIRRGIKTVACLWIDDISKLAETKSGFEISFLDDIIRWRDLNKLTTLYTSQLPFDSKDEFLGLDNALSKPIHDIIRGNSLILTFRGESQR